MINEVIIKVKNVCKIVCYICIEVMFYFIEYSYDIVCYIFIVVIVCIFNYGKSI